MKLLFLLVACAAVLPTKTVVASRPIEGLLDWAQANGVRISDGISLQHDKTTGAMGITASQPFPEGSVLIEVPNDLVLSSTMLNREIQKRVIDIIGEGGSASIFHLMLVVLQELRKGKDSKWDPYFQSIPENTGISLLWNEHERSYAKSIGLGGSIAVIDGLYKCFEQLAKTVSPEHAGDKQVMMRAFTICQQRPWMATYTTEEGETVANLVCIGDMFNHAEDGAVGVSQVRGGSVKLRSCVAVGEGPLYMNYFHKGGHYLTAPKCVVQYGFCDKSNLPMMGTINQMVQIVGDSDAKRKELSSMGLDPHDLFISPDGTLSDNLWNAALYLELRYLATEARDYLVNRDERHSIEKPKYNCTELLPDLKICDAALQTLYGTDNSVDMVRADTVEKARARLALGSLHKKYRPEVVKSMLQGLDWALTNFGPLPGKKEDDEKHPHRGLLREWHEHLVSTHEKAIAYLEGGGSYDPKVHP